MTTGVKGSAAHGTHSGAVAHYRRGELPCQECRAAENAYQRAWNLRSGKTKTTMELIRAREWPHGTLRRYRRGCHCAECRRANTDYCREHRDPVKAEAYRKAYVEANRERIAAYHREWSKRKRGVR